MTENDANLPDWMEQSIQRGVARATEKAASELARLGSRETEREIVAFLRNRADRLAHEQREANDAGAFDVARLISVRKHELWELADIVEHGEYRKPGARA